MIQELGEQTYAIRHKLANKWVEQYNPYFPDGGILYTDKFELARHFFKLRSLKKFLKVLTKNKVLLCRDWEIVSFCSSTKDIILTISIDEMITPTLIMNMLNR